MQAEGQHVHADLENKSMAPASVACAVGMKEGQGLSEDRSRSPLLVGVGNQRVGYIQSRAHQGPDSVVQMAGTVLTSWAMWLPRHLSRWIHDAASCEVIRSHDSAQRRHKSAHCFTAGSSPAIRSQLSAQRRQSSAQSVQVRS